jgi:hypothetical protein
MYTCHTAPVLVVLHGSVIASIQVGAVCCVLAYELLMQITTGKPPPRTSTQRGGVLPGMLQVLYCQLRYCTLLSYIRHRGRGTIEID